MKKRQTPALATALALLLLVLFLSQAAPPPTLAAGSPPPASPAEGDSYRRAFDWTGADKQARHIDFALAKADVRIELSQFGVPRGMESTLMFEKRGFQRVAVYQGKEIYMVDYAGIFRRNLGYFPGLTAALRQALAPLPATGTLLAEFLFFVQAVRYQKPPYYYGNKFINSFFPPLVCLYEQYGDCDCKSLLLAAFLGSQDEREKPALALITGQGLKHTVLLVRRTPQPGMSALFITNKGYYIPLESSSPGWAPGFVDARVWNALSSGEFRFQELQ